jgi:hypothetical protein
MADQGGAQSKPTMSETVNTPKVIDSYLRDLTESVWKMHYQKDAPQWEMLDDTYGVLTQLDNMICDLMRTPPAA